MLNSSEPFAAHYIYLHTTCNTSGLKLCKGGAHLVGDTFPDCRLGMTPYLYSLKAECEDDATVTDCPRSTLAITRYIVLYKFLYLYYYHTDTISYNLPIR